MPRVSALLTAAAGLCLLTHSSAFTSPPHLVPSRPVTSSNLELSVFGRGGGGGGGAVARSTQPKFNPQTERWEPSPNDDITDCYSPVGSLLRHGPSPFFQRLTNADAYEQAVLKYQASEGCSRREAMGNMDAYFNNAADWAFQKNAEKNGAPKVDYARLDVEQAVKTTVWGVFITPFLLRIVYLIVTTGSYGVTLDDVFSF